MRDKFILSDLSIFNSSEMLIKSEVLLSNRIPDLVIIKSCYPLNQMIINKWSYKKSYITWSLRLNGPLDLSEISSFLFERDDHIIPTIEELINYGIISTNKNGKYFIKSKYFLSKYEIIAVELKLNKWKQALDQAIDYKGFADKVIVGMDRDYINDKYFDQFVQNGVGLIAIDDSSSNTIISPTQNDKKYFGPEYDYIIGSAFSRSDYKLWVR